MWLTIGGAVFAAGGLWLFAVARYRMRRWLRASAEVVDLDRTYDSEGGWTYAPIVSFRAADGSEVRARTQGWAARPLVPRPGKQVRVLYNPARPRSGVMIDSFLGRGDVASIPCLVIGGWLLALQAYHAFR